MRHRIVLVVALVVALTCSTLTASAEGPGTEVAAVDVSDWDVADYNNAIAQEGLTALKQVYAEVPRGMFTPSPMAMEDMRLDMMRVLQTRRDALVKLPAWEGDTGMRDAAVAAFDATLQTFDGEVKSLYGLMAKEDIRNADLVRAEELFTALDERSLSIDTALKKEQGAFADRNNLRLVEGSEPEPVLDLPVFEAPGIPPEGRTLPSNVFMNFTVSYTNGVLFRANGVMEALNLCFAINPESDAKLLIEEAKRSRKRIEKVQQQLQAMDEDWQGERSLMEGARDLAKVGIEVTVMMEKWAGLWLKGTRSQADVDAINGLGAELNKTVEAGTAAFQQQELTWRQRWHIDAYNAFVLKHQAVAQPQEPAEATKAP